jgi:lysophospholipase L1-like esterase
MPVTAGSPPDRLAGMRTVVRALPVLIAVAALLPAGLRSLPVTSESVWQQAAPVRIMPLGDSNTAGADSAQGGYRTDLWQLLAADGREVDFVGQGSAGGPALPDKNHEGHGGWTIQQIHDNVIGWLQTHQPQIVLLQIGTNDMYSDASTAGAPSRMTALLNRITSTAPDAEVVVTTLPPLADAAHNRRVQAFNEVLPGLVGSLAGAGRKVRLADTGSALIQGDLIDPFHPGYGAVSRAAARWYSALTGIGLTRYEAEQTSNATLVNAVRLANNVSSSGGTKVGKIDFPDSSVTFTVHATAAGPHRIRIRGGNGMTTVCSHNLSVNGGPATVVRYQNLGWENWTMVGVDLTLNAGPNTLRFTKGDCYAEIDTLYLSGPTS